MPVFRPLVLSAFAAHLAALSLPATAGNPDRTLDALAESLEIPVTIDNFVRAATDIELGKYVSLAGGVNRFFHFRTPTRVERQPTIRMNRDTLYSTAVIDIREGATLTLPDVGDRYMTAMVVNQDHYINEVFFGGGTYTLDMASFDTPYVIVFLRVLVDASDPEDVAAVNVIQDRMTVEAGSAEPFVVPDYDEESFEGLLRATIEIGRFAPDSFRVFGRKEDVEPVRHFLGTAVGWGGLPETEAFYLNAEPGLPVGTYRIDVPADVPVGAFWSVSLYNAEGFFEPNPLGAYSVNSVNGTPNDDGSITVHLGGCDDGRVNCLPIMEGWNYTVRLYRPEPAILDGSWVFPAARPADAR
ncbi:DUF1214 domain-containing protein [Limibaculum sp. M0105]|uniref:DUF1214 domain-containing protein n=1 Tax=Thermohalobaculum xanthum TaxID=2753746 RepID=A0A8J7SAT7_9RHOB|nr:DUF1214 domain-containing protein [Thermohalobaculum xanthum]MBK0398552.1 DUF1214 domain-containing protein [Thermohalobaculum xanthum]